MKVLVAGDSFKGSLTAFEFTETVAKVLRSHGAECRVLALSDGGEGSLEILTKLFDGRIEKTVASNALLNPVTVKTGITDKACFIESAQAIGLPQLKGNTDICRTSSYGVGEMIAFAVKHNLNDIVLTLGGTASDDGGAGMLCALGARFSDGQSDFIPTSGTLCRIKFCDLTPSIRLLEHTRVTVLSDVKNPMLGSNGATYVYAPQKGATADFLPFLEKSMEHYANIVNRHTHTDRTACPGAGAGGGLGFACMQLPHVTFLQGSNAILDMVNFDGLVKQCDWVITGEGKFDKQSYMGKIVGNVINRSKGKNIAVICGVADEEMYNDKNIKLLREIGKNKPDSLTNAKKYLTEETEKLFPLLSGC